MRGEKTGIESEKRKIKMAEIEPERGEKEIES